MEILLIAITGAMNLFCFVIGAKVGQSVSKGEKVEMPNLNPLKAIRDSQVKRALSAEQEKRQKILDNIERYDGTSRGQQDVG